MYVDSLESHFEGDRQSYGILSGYTKLQHESSYCCHTIATSSRAPNMKIVIDEAMTN